LNAKDTAKLALELRDKLGATVRDNHLKGSTIAIHVQHIKLCHIFSYNCLIIRN